MSAINHVIMWNKQIIKNKHNLRDKSLWVFGEWWGKRCCDNSCYFANYVVENVSGIKCFWLTSSDTNTMELDERISVVEWKTDKAKGILKKAGVVIVNQNLQDVDNEFDFSCSGAIIINLWHGVPWKKIGLKAVPREKYLYSLYQAYVLKIQRINGFLCSGKVFEEKYMKAFLVKKDQLIRAGQPRNLLMYDKYMIEECYQKIRMAFSIDSKAKIVSYLPTFRDSHTTPFSFSEISDESFLSYLESNNIYILQKAHTEESELFKTGTDHIINVVDVSAQELMAASDMLITDYSSCFFDYLLLDRPIIHYLYDYEYYKDKDRGLYFDKDDVVCGSVAYNEQELINEIKLNISNPDKYLELRKKRKEDYLTYENCDNCKTITEYIMSELNAKKMID